MKTATVAVGFLVLFAVAVVVVVAIVVVFAFRNSAITKAPHVVEMGRQTTASPTHDITGKTTPRGKKVMNPRDPTGRGRFYAACYGPDDGYAGKGAFSNDLVAGSIALPRGRKDGKEAGAGLSRETLLTTAFDHPLVAPELRARGPTWTHDEEYAFMKDEKNRPRYLMVDEDGTTETCVRVDDKCEGCYWGDRGFEGTKGFDVDVYVPDARDATCATEKRPNQWVTMYEVPDGRCP